ncbi:MAG TPA: alpha/beta fold hydrolase [Terriglobia bacterium]|nr:alpha/beta fold hydrolase [Terriglobia bacterium]
MVPAAHWKRGAIVAQTRALISGLQVVIFAGPLIVVGMLAMASMQRAQTQDRVPGIIASVLQGTGAIAQENVGHARKPRREVNQSRAARVSAATTIGRLPLAFELNQGQADPSVKFLSRGRGFTLFLTGNEALLAIPGAKRSRRRLGPPSMQQPSAHSWLFPGSLLEAPFSPPQNRVPQFSPGQEGSTDPPSTLSSKSSLPATTALPPDTPKLSNPEQVQQPQTIWGMRLLGANLNPQVVGVGELPSKSNYFIGNDKNKWQKKVPQYARVKYNEVYPGIDVVYYGYHNQLEYDFVIAPNADPSKIRLELARKTATGIGNESPHLQISSEGDLVITTPTGNVSFRKPIIYQWVSDSKLHRKVKHLVDGHFVLHSLGRPDKDSRKVSTSQYVSFEVAYYDHHKPLIIDPVLSFSTYLGGSSDDYGWSVAVDGSGNSYITGTTISPDFPTTASAYDTSCGTDSNCDSASYYDVFVTKLDAAGSLVYSTYIGGSNSDIGIRLTTDASGATYVTGLTSSVDFPTANALQSSLGGTQDAFVSKLSPDGSSLVYSTYLGGSGLEAGRDVAVDAFGDAYVAGWTTSGDFPITTGAYQTACGDFFFCSDAFVTELGPLGNTEVYSTYLGGSGRDQIDSLGIDSSGDAYVAGFTESSNFPTQNGFQTSLAGGMDAFLTKLNNTGSSILYSSYLGGTNEDRVEWMAVDAQGSAYVTGTTFSSDFPTRNAVQSVLSGAQDALVAKINPALTGNTSVIYSTYLGGAGAEEGRSIGVDSSGNAYVTGFTDSTDFPVLNAIQATNAGGFDVYVAKLNASGSHLIFSTYLGGTGTDGGTTNTDSMGIAVDSSGNAYVTGKTDSTDFPVANAMQSTNAGSLDVFVAKLSGLQLPVPTFLPTSITFAEQAVGTASAPESITLTNVGDASLSISGISLTGADPTDFSSSADTCSGATITPNGSCTVSVTFTPSAIGTRTASLAITDNASTSPETVSLTGTGAGAVVTLSPLTLPFGDQIENTPSASKQVTLTNTGNASLTITGVTISANFSQTNNCGSNLAANSGCTIDVTFTPTTTGSLTGTLSVADNATDSPQTVSLTGTGITGTGGITTVTYSPTTLNFTSQPVDSTSSGQVVTLTNTGSNPLTFTGFSIQGNFAVDPAGTTCDVSVPVAPGLPCSISVTYTPVALVSDSGTLSISDNAGNGTQTVTLTGTATPMPLVFIPGAPGSELDLIYQTGIHLELWPIDLDPTDLLPYSSLSLFSQDNYPSGIRATDIIRDPLGSLDVAGKFHIYDKLINFLEQSGYVEYDIAGDPARLTTGGCDDQAQKANHPTLFLFPYDWRKDNAFTAQELADYIGCVHKFYPSTSKVNMLAHSMGGLVARRYILDYSPSYVNRLVTIATPWVGAPDFLNVMATGEFGPFAKWIVFDPVFQHISRSFPGLHETIPPKAYFDLVLPSQAPLGDAGRDLDGDNDSFDIYSDYSHYLSVIDTAGVFSDNGVHPGVTTDTFHSYSKGVNNQDNWNSDTTGVKYFQLFGVQSKRKTVAQVFATDLIDCLTSQEIEECSILFDWGLNFTWGDGTVPEVSATRQGNGQQYGPNQTLYMFPSTSWSTDDTVEHLGLTQNPSVQDCVYSLFNDVNAPQCPSTTTSAAAIKAAATTTPTPYYYVAISGADSVIVSDTAGNNTAPFNGGPLRGVVPNVDTYVLGDKVTQVVLPSANQYTITFQTTSRALGIQMTLGTGDSVTQAIRYQDLAEPAGKAAKLQFTGSGVSSLSVDTAGDGSFSTVINPTVDVSGAAATDTTPPVISFASQINGSLTAVSISAVDSGAGVRDIFYSLDGTTFQPYTAPLQLDATQTPVMYAFADDNVANRSGLAAFTVPLAPDFAVGANPTTATVSAGQPATYTVTLTPQAGFNQPVSLACTGAPSKATCTVSPASVTPDGTNPAQVTVKVTTTAASHTLPGPRGGPPPPSGFSLHEWWIAFLFLLMLGTLALAFNECRQRVPLLAGAVLLATIAVSCGGGGGGSTVTNPGTPKGNYTLTVTGTSGSLQHSTTVTLVVN